MRTRIGELEDDIEDRSSRPRGGYSESKHDDLRHSEDRFVTDGRLKDELEHARRLRLDLETALLERDTVAMETKFDLETAQQDVERYKRRTRELEENVKIWKNSSQAHTDGHSSTGRGGTMTNRKNDSGGGMTVAGAASRREKELEGLVESLTRAIEKLKTENLRIQRVGGASERKTHDGDKAAVVSKKKIESLTEEISGLQLKLKSFDETNQKLVQRQQQITSLRKQLKSHQEEIHQLTEKRDAIGHEKDALAHRLAASDSKIQQLELQLASRLSAKAAHPPAEMTRELAMVKKSLVEKDEVIQSQDDVIKQLEAEAKAAKNRSSGAPEGFDGRSATLDSRGLNAGSNQKLLNELKEAKSENALLREELSAFDLDFFEEIENLKYEHAEAVKKVKMYEQRHLR